MNPGVVSTGSFRGAPHRDDVLCLIKRYVSDTQLSQSPLLTLPAERRDLVGLVPADKNLACMMSAFLGGVCSMRFFERSHSQARQQLQQLRAGQLHGACQGGPQHVRGYPRFSREIFGGPPPLLAKAKSLSGNSVLPGFGYKQVLDFCQTACFAVAFLEGGPSGHR